ncbi:MAG: two-component regulator propeller domain-containing protein, partial [Dehalococcoidales bacterium]
IGTKKGLNLFNYTTKTFSAYLNNPEDPGSISNDDISSICEDNSGYLWVGTYIGLNKLDIDKESFTNYTNDNELTNSIINNRIQTIYKDNEGILWIGTINGISILNFDNQVFRFYPFNYSTVYAIDSDNDNRLWLQVGLDLVKFDLESGCITTTYSNMFDFIEIKQDRTSGVSLAPAFSLGIDGYIWIGTTDSGIKRLNSATGEIKKYIYVPNSNNSLPCNNITSLFVSHEGTVWIGTKDGLCSLNPYTDEITRYKHNPEYPEEIQNDAIFHIYETSNHDLWFTTILHTYRFDRTNKVFINITPGNEFNSIGGFDYCSMCEGRNGLLWIGKGSKLYYYDLEKEQLSPYREGENLISFDYIYGIIEDSYGDIWVPTFQGVWQLSIKDDRYVHYDLADGLKSDTFRPLSYFKTNDGTIYLGCLTGLIECNPENIEENTYKPRVLISNFTLLNKPSSFDTPIEDIQKITLPYSNNSFVIDFADTNFGSSAKTLFAYKLDGFDKDWHYCSPNEHSAKYTNISNGEYTFLVKASDSNDNWDTECLSLIIDISPPFWKEWWFILLLFGVVAIVIKTIINLKTRSLNLRTKELASQVDKKTSQLAEKTEQLEQELNKRIGFTRIIIHELKTPITSLQIANELLLEEAKDPPFIELAHSIENSINSLEKRTNELLDIIRGEMGLLKIDVQSIDLEVYLNEISLDILLVAKNKGKNITIDIQDNLGYAEIDAERIKQVINNLIDNACKFTKKHGLLGFSAKAEDGQLLLIISDDGCGINDNRQKSIFDHGLNSALPTGSEHARFNGLGIGLILSKMIVELHGGKISVESKVNQGSVFTVFIPYQQSKE